MSKIMLFCIPYAGGSAVVYKRWRPYLHEDIALTPVELAGRGSRMQEPLYRDVPEVIEDVFQIIRKSIGHTPYALFGHSMGGMICYELAKKIHAAQLPAPQHIFFSGRGAPHVHRTDEKKFHLMNEQDFREEVLKLGGTPPEFFNHPELLELFLPMLKNDFKLSETETGNGAIHPLNTSITVFVGTTEDLNEEQRFGWTKHTTAQCQIHQFEGGHFFLHDHAAQIAQHINHILFHSS